MPQMNNKFLWTTISVVRPTVAFQCGCILSYNCYIVLAFISIQIGSFPNFDSVWSDILHGQCWTLAMFQIEWKRLDKSKCLELAFTFELWFQPYKSKRMSNRWNAFQTIIKMDYFHLLTFIDDWNDTVIDISVATATNDDVLLVFILYHSPEMLHILYCEIKIDTNLLRLNSELATMKLKSRELLPKIVQYVNNLPYRWHIGRVL